MFRILTALLALTCLPVLKVSSQATDSVYHLMLKGLYAGTIPAITPDELHQKLNMPKYKTILLDTRSKEEYKVSHLQGARLVGYDAFQVSQVRDLPKDAAIIVYCTVGYRSEKIGEKLKKAGYMNVYNLYGGIFEWVNKGFAVHDAKGPTTKVHAYSPAWGVWLQKGEKVYE